MAHHQTPYLAYLLRIWQEDHNGHSIWRASLERPGSNKRYAFPDFISLMTFLSTEMSAQQTTPTDSKK